MMMQRIAHESYCPRANFLSAFPGSPEPCIIAPSSQPLEGKSHKRIFKVLTPRIARLPELPRSGKRGPDEFVY